VGRGPELFLSQNRAPCNEKAITGSLEAENQPPGVESIKIRGRKKGKRGTNEHELGTTSDGSRGKMLKEIGRFVLSTKRKKRRSPRH